MLVHEFGHFIVAKKSGMVVEEFGFGFPPRLVGIQKIDGKWRFIAGHKSPLPNPPHQGEGIGQAGADNTIYSINLIPFGGFVKIKGENNEHESDPRSFVNRPFWARFLTLVAGVSMNWILAAVLFFLVFAIGTTSEIIPGDALFKNAHITNPQVAIAEVAKNSPAEHAGLMPGDIILKIDGQSQNKTGEIRDYIYKNKGKIFEFEIQRVKEVKKIKVQSFMELQKDQGPTGISPTDIGTLRLPVFAAASLGVQKAWGLTKLTFWGIGQLFVSKDVLKSVGGPVKIAKLTGEVATLGITSLMNFAAVLSVNLAVLNILPIPALDGGRVLFLLIEKIRRKKNNQKVEQWVNAAGFVVLICLMILVTIKDIVKK